MKKVSSKYRIHNVSHLVFVLPMNFLLLFSLIEVSVESSHIPTSFDIGIFVENMRYFFIGT